MHAEKPKFYGAFKRRSDAIRRALAIPGAALKRFTLPKGGSRFAVFTKGSQHLPPP